MTSAPTGKNNRSNPYYAKSNHIKLAKIDRNRSEFFGTIGGVPDSPVSINGLLTDSLGRYAQIDTALTYTLTEGTATAQSWTVDGALKATTAGYTPVAADNAGIVDVSVTIGGEQFTASNPAQVRYAQATAANIIPPQSWTVGEAITPLDASVNFTIPTGNTGTYSSTNLPPNLIINAQSGVITGTVANEGSGNINVRFTDSYGRVTSSTFAWSATAALEAPQVTASSSVSGRTVTVTIDSLTGNPPPTTTCTGNVTWSGTSGGPYTYTAPSSATGTTANWTVTATNGIVPDATDSGSETVPADLFAPVITGVPTITGTTTVGQTLTATPASVSGNPTPARTWQWERDNVPIAGATNSTYVLALADEGSTLTVVQTETNSEGADSAESVATDTIVHVAPVAAGLLVDQSFTDNTGNQTYDVSGDFIGEALNYSVQTGPAGVTVNASTGVVTFDTNALDVQSGTSIVIRATNSGGFADSGFSLDITAVPATAPAAFTAGQWTVDTGTGNAELDINITALPDDGGSAITALQYQLDALAWQDLAGTQIDLYTITAPAPDTSYDVKIRAVNAVGSGADSDTKTATSGSAVVPSSDFVFTVRTENPGETMTIPCQNNGVFDAVVQSDTAAEPHLTGAPVTAFNDSNLVVTFPNAGDHQITISGTFPNIYFNNTGDRDKLISVDAFGAGPWLALDAAFRGCRNMTSFNGANADTSQVASMSAMFRGCSDLTTAGTSGWDTGQVTIMTNMFRDCSGLTTPPDTSNWDTSQVTTMGYMWISCSNLTTSPDTSNWNTAQVTIMTNMFRDCSKIATAPDMSGPDWNTSKVTIMNNMFRGCSSMVGLDVSTFDVGAVTDLTDFMLNASMSTAAYDATLIAWEAQTVNPNLNCHFGSSLFTPGGDAEAAKTRLVNNDGWTITDGGPA